MCRYHHLFLSIVESQFSPSRSSNSLSVHCPNLQSTFKSAAEKQLCKCHTLVLLLYPYHWRASPICALVVLVVLCYQSAKVGYSSVHRVRNCVKPRSMLFPAGCSPVFAGVRTECMTIRNLTWFPHVAFLTISFPCRLKLRTGQERLAIATN